MSAFRDQQPASEAVEAETFDADADAFRDELEGRVFRHVPSLVSRYFTNWATSARLALEVHRQNRASFAQPPQPSEISSHKDFSAWLESFRLYLRQYSQARVQLQDIAEYVVQFPGGTQVAQIYFVDYQSKSVRAMGEYCISKPKSDADEVLRFCDTARKIFAANPARMFLRGFQIRATTVELWVFDRAGAYSSRFIDIAKKPELLMRLFASYVLMDDREAGLNTFLQLNNRRLSIGIDDIEGKRRLFYLESAIAGPEYLIGPGTTCYAARTPLSGSPEFVVKFAWREGGAYDERDMLQLTRARKVWGVITAVGWRDLGTIADHREGLRFTTPFTFSQGAMNPPDVNQDSEVANQAREDGQDPRLDRTLSCMVTYPLGHAINTFSSVLDFLEACRDVVKALGSLYRDGNLLHRDICIKNLIITSNPSRDFGKGALIDLDLAWDLNRGPTKTGELVGSEGFMAIGIMTGDPHTYRHDLESLFYVFLWISICKDREHKDKDSLRYQPPSSRLWGWCSTNFRWVAQNKIADMSPEGFPMVLAEFSEDFEHLKGLAVELRDLLFPMRDDSIFTGTDMDQASTDRLYEMMISVFERYIHG